MSASTLQTIGVVFQILGVGVLIGGMVKSRRDLGLPPTRFGRAITRARQTVVRVLARKRNVTINVTAADTIALSLTEEAAVTITSPSWNQLDTEGKLERLHEHLERLARADEKL